MDPLLVLICPCFRENVTVTCKFVSLLCSLDSFLLNNVIIFFFGNQISKWHSFEKKNAIFDLLFTFCSHQGKDTKNPSAHISLAYIHVFCSPYWLFCLTNFAKNMNLSCSFFFFFLKFWCYSCCWFFFRSTLEQSINNKMMSKILVGMSSADIYLH